MVLGDNKVGCTQILEVQNLALNLDKSSPQDWKIVNGPVSQWHVIIQRRKRFLHSRTDSYWFRFARKAEPDRQIEANPSHLGLSVGEREGGKRGNGKGKEGGGE